MENLAMTFCYLWLTEKLWLLGGGGGFISSIVSFPGCYALHFGIMYVRILYTLYIQIVC